MLALLLLAACAAPRETGEPSGGEAVALAVQARELAERLRGRRITADVQYRSLGREALARRVARELHSGLHADELALEQARYELLGLLDGCEELAACVTLALGRQMAGLYDPESRSLFVVDDVTGPDVLGVLVHEWTHALQHERLDLVAATRPHPGQGDFGMARRALLEGEATLVMAAAQFASTAPGGVSPERVVPVLSAARAELAPRVRAEIRGRLLREPMPAVFAEELAFLYGDGLAFVLRAHARGGWRAVESYDEDIVPLSTEQVLHPERTMDCPLAMALPAWKAAGHGGLRRLGPDTLGEAGYRGFFRVWAPPEKADPVAEGWGGDAYFVYVEPDSGRRALALLSEWDSATDAKQACGFLRRLPGDAFPGAIRELRCEGRRVLLWTGELPPPDGHLAALLRGTVATPVCDAHFFEAQPPSR